MIRKSLIGKLFEGFTMQRWNDQLRPTQLVEIDKQAHAVCLAYFLARSIEGEEDIDMHELMELIIFHYLERIIVTDIKPTVFSRIKTNDTQFKALRTFVKESMLPYLEGVPKDFVDKFTRWCDEPAHESLASKILEIARADATLWEFELLYHANPRGFGMEDIANDMQNLQNKHIVLKRHLVSKLETKHIREENKTDLFANENYSSYEQLVKMFGQMRFQVRWAQLHREPKTTILGHSFFVALLTYFFSLEAGACPKRLYNNFFTSIFHDLPEVFTRDIISPLKNNIPGLGDLIKQIEHEEMNEKFKMLIPQKLIPELFYFIDDEFADLTLKDGVETSHKAGIPDECNDDDFCPKDGTIVRLADQMAAFVEADMALANGATSSEFITAKERIKMKYSSQKVAGLDLNSLFLDFK